MEIISIEFEYRQITYFALVRIKIRHVTEYHVTIMNGELEQQLYGNHIYIHGDDGIQINPIPSGRVSDLRLAVGEALCKHFKVSNHSLEKNG